MNTLETPDVSILSTIIYSERPSGNTRDIGDLEVLLELAQEEDLDTADLWVALQEGRYT